MFEAGQAGSISGDLIHRSGISRDSDFYGCTGQPWDIYTDSELVYLS